MIYVRIPGNDRLKINKEGKILPLYNKDLGIYESLFTIDKDNNISLEMYGKKRRVNLLWLATVATLNIEMPEGYEEFIFNYRFKKANRINRNTTEDKFSSRLPFEIVFSEPVYYTKDFRIIAEFPNYAVSENMEFINIKTGVKINPRTNGENTYPSLSLYNNLGLASQTRLAHVITAITWVENDDFVKRPLVNHIDGDKSNFRAKNLEWASYSENIKHAYAAGLRSDNHPIKMYDKVKKEIKIFASVTDAFKSFGANPRANLSALFKERNGYYIAKNRYEIRYLSDKRDFVLLNTSINKAIQSTVIARSRTYQAINIKTKEEVIGSNGIIQKSLGLSESGVTAICRKKTLYNDWIIRDYTTKPLDISEYKAVQNKKASVVVTDISSGIKTEYASLREAGREVKLDPITIKRLIVSKNIVRNMTFEYKEE